MIDSYVCAKIVFYPHPPRRLPPALPHVPGCKEQKYLRNKFVLKGSHNDNQMLILLAKIDFA